MKKSKHEEKPLNSIFGVSIGIPELSKTGMAITTSETFIGAYETEAKAFLKKNGYPQSIEELWLNEKKFLPDLRNGKGLSQVYSAFWCLVFLERTRCAVAENNADLAVCDMAGAIHWAIRARLKDVVGKINQGEAMTIKKDEAQKKRISKGQLLKDVAKALIAKYPFEKDVPGVMKKLTSNPTIVKVRGQDCKVWLENGRQDICFDWNGTGAVTRKVSYFQNLLR